MPTYLYECEKCGRFEKFQKITDNPLKKCPECESSVKRIIGAPGIIFKGSGFYSTDSKTSTSSVKGAATTNGETKSVEKKEVAASKDTGDEKVS